MFSNSPDDEQRFAAREMDRALVAHARALKESDLNEGWQLVTQTEAARLLRVGVRTLARWRKKGCGPKPIRRHRWIRYSIAEIRRWVWQNTDGSPEPPAQG